MATETVKTRTHTVMLFIARNEFQELLTLCPELKTRLELRYTAERYRYGVRLSRFRPKVYQLR